MFVMKRVALLAAAAVAGGLFSLPPVPAGAQAFGAGVAGMGSHAAPAQEVEYRGGGGPGRAGGMRAGGYRGPAVRAGGYGGGGYRAGGYRAGGYRGAGVPMGGYRGARVVAPAGRYGAPRVSRAGAMSYNRAAWNRPGGWNRPPGPGPGWHHPGPGWRPPGGGWGRPGWAFRPGWGWNRPGWGWGWYDNSGAWIAAAAVGALAVGAAAAATSDDVYYDDAIAYCAQRYRSYDVRTQTYLGYDGLRHSCP